MTNSLRINESVVAVCSEKDSINVLCPILRYEQGKRWKLVQYLTFNIEDLL